MGRRFRSRGKAINGVIVLDKPKGCSSRQALNKVNQIVHAQKIGHTGSLDPMATGVLPLVLGHATKFSQYLLDADKEYDVTATLGISTVSGDSDGEVIREADVDSINVDDIDRALASYRGEIMQVPPMYSALKHEGQPLYKLARKGIHVEREPRQQTIFKNEIVSYRGTELKLRLHCSKGTYVRTVVHDLGEDLGCGAHVSALRRTRAGPFNESQLVTMSEIEAAQLNRTVDALLKPVESTIGHWPLLEINKVAAFHAKQGQPIAVAHSLNSGWVGLFEQANDQTQRGDFLGVGQILDDGRIAPRRLIS